MTKAIELSQLGGLLTTSSTEISVRRTIEVDEPNGNTATLTVQTQATSGNDAVIKIRGARTNAPDNHIAMLQFDNKTSSAYTMATISARDFAGDHTLGDGSLLFRTTDNGTLSDSMTILSGGNVGIGTTNPSDKLQVDGSIKIAAAAPIIKLAETGVTGNPSWWIVQDGGNFSLRNNNASPYPFRIATKGTNRDETSFVAFGGDTIQDALTLTAHGTNPTYLDLKGNDANARMRYFEGTTERWNIGYDTGVDAFTFYDTQNSSSSVVFKDGGNVGIGTVTPNAKLHVVGDTDLDGIVNIGDGTSNAYQLNIETDDSGNNDNTISGLRIDCNGWKNDQSSKYGSIIDIDSLAQDAITANRTKYGSQLSYTTFVPPNASTSDGTQTTFYGSRISLTLDDAFVDGTLQYSTGKVNNAFGIWVKNRINHAGGANVTVAGEFISQFSDDASSNSQSITEAYGSRNRVINDGNNTTIAEAFGTYSWINQDDASGVMTKAYGNYAFIERDGGTITDGYLFYGKYDGTVGTKYGIYLENETKSYLSGSLGIGVNAPSVELDVVGSVKASSQLISSVATGTAPLSVASTTVVNNLNADKLDGQEGSYYTNRVTTTTLTSTDNLNSLTNEGWYKWAAANPSNSPSDYGVMWMIKDASQLQQMVQTYGGNANSVRLYGRRKTSGSWDTTWTEYWSTVNDGAASGLNADKLDDLHAASFLRSDANTTFNCSGNDFQFDYDTSRTLIRISQLGTEKLRLSASSNTITLDSYNSGTLVIAANVSFSSVTTPITTNSIKFNNTEMSSTYYTNATGVLAFDENFSTDSEYGTDAYAPAQIFTGGDGGGLVIKNEDGWGGVFTSQNTRFATPVFAGITSGLATLTKNGAFAAKIGGNSGGAYFLELGQLSASSSPGINATGTSASMRFHINGSEKMRIGPTGNVGIGTNDPNAATLQVWGTSAFGGTASTSRRTDIDTNGKVKIRFDDNNNTDVLTIENRATNASLGHGASIKWNFGDSSGTAAHSAARIAVIQQTTHTSSTNTHDTEMRFSVANNDVLTERMEIKCNGIVKFGTAAEISPSDHIEVGRGSGSLAMTINDGYGNCNLCFNHRDGIPDASTSGQSSGRIECGVDGSNARMYFELKDSVSNGTAVSLTNVLDLDIGVVNVSGNLTATGTVTGGSSDGRLKENLVRISTPLDKVDQLHGYTFDWKAECEGVGFTPVIPTNDIGLIAQDVQAVVPQAVAPAPFDHQLSDDGTEDVSITGETYLTVQYERLVPLLVEAIKELRQEVESLKSQISGS